MSRVMVFGSYENSKYVLKYSTGSEKNQVFKVLEANDKIEFGNSNQYFWIKKVRSKTGSFLSIVKIKEEHFSLHNKQLHSIYRHQHGFDLFNGSYGSWALTGICAKRGLFLVLKPNRNPLTHLLKQSNIPSRTLSQKEMINELGESGTVDLGSTETNKECTIEFLTDGDLKLISPKPSINFNDPSTIRAIGSKLYKVQGGTYFIEFFTDYPKEGEPKKEINKIIITENTNHLKVATLTHELIAAN